MEDTFSQTEPTPGAPWHLWVVGGLTLVWNVFCAARFVAVQYGVTDFGSSASSELAVFAAMPMWGQASWALSVWAGVAGSALLLLRSKWALQAFVAAVVGLIGTSACQFAFSGPVASIYDMPIALAVWFITMASLLYVSRVQTAGSLR